MNPTIFLLCLCSDCFTPRSCFCSKPPLFSFHSFSFWSLVSVLSSSKWPGYKNRDVVSRSVPGHWDVSLTVHTKNKRKNFIFEGKILQLASYDFKISLSQKVALSVNFNKPSFFYSRSKDKGFFNPLLQQLFLSNPLVFSYACYLRVSPTLNTSHY